MTKIKGNFRQMVRRFLDGNRNYYESGDWSIAQGGYDCWFELYYKKRCLITCINGRMIPQEVRIEGTNKLIDTKKLMKILKEESNGDYLYDEEE